MSTRKCDRVVSAIARQPWAITPDGLELVLGIAQRSVSDHHAVLASPTERRESGSVRMRDGIAIISVMGPIFPRADFFTEISGATSIETLALRFGEAVASDDVKGIVLHVDSPGGSVTGVHEFAGQIFAAREVKPVVAYVSGVGASAAYWLASAAQRVVADETALLGSIGVVAAWTDDKEARKAAGLTDYEVVSSQSPNKRLDPATQAGRAALQRLLDADADIFIADVARHRGKSVETVRDQFGQGGVMHAAEAVKVGMADEVGSLEGVIAALSGVGGWSETGRAAHDARIKKEIHMDYATLAAKHPELLADITAKATAEAAKSHEAALETAAQTTQKNVLALVKIVAGEASATKVEQLLVAGIGPEQAKAFSEITGQTLAQAPAQAEAATQEKDDKKEEILTALKNATPEAVAGTVPPSASQKSALLADAERRAAESKA